MRFTFAAAAVLAVSAIKLEREPTDSEVYAQLTEEEKAMSILSWLKKAFDIFKSNSLTRNLL